MDSFTFSPIGFFVSERKYRFETPRQGVFSDDAGVVELADDPRMIDACRDLAGVDRIWLVFVFHLNAGWKSCVRPPVAPAGRRISVLATRSPHRPNPIGLSCVELLRVERNRLFVRRCDLLDGTPILDVKPYVPEADAFPDSHILWRDAVPVETYTVEVEIPAAEKFAFIAGNGGPDLENFVRVQLSLKPLDSGRKRIVSCTDGTFRIGCRTWQIAFSVEGKIVRVHDVFSHYQEMELNSPDDRYGDKTLHRAFAARFKN